MDYGITASQAYFALHETLHKVQENIFLGTEVTSEAFLSIF
jgi:hypothetical protein